MSLAGLVTLGMEGSVSALGAVPRIFAGMDSITLVAIPFFILSGALMESGKISEGLVNFSRAWVGHLKGGLAYVCVLSCMLFAAVSGSSLATAVAFGSLLAPAMKKDGYETEFIAALQACGGTLGPIIPPSILFIMYASIASVSIGGLFIAGAIPGVIMGISLMVVSFFYSRKHKIAQSEPMPYGQRLVVTAKSILALIMPVIIIGGTLAGFCSPSEAGMVACVYAIIVGSIVFKGIKLKDMPRVFGNAAMTSSMVLMMMGFAGVMNYTLTRMNFAQMVGRFLQSMVHSSTGVLLIITAFLLVICCFMDANAALLIFTPIFYPLATIYSINPLHLGLIIVVCIVIGQVTPPVGVLLSATAQLHKIPVHMTYKYVWPMLLSLIICTFIFIFVPQLSTWLPSIMMN
jgi:C4-dicarboxylate transporter DctM subunit